MPRKLGRKLLRFTKFKRRSPPGSSSNTLSPDHHYHWNQTDPTLVKCYNALYHDDHNTIYSIPPKPLGAYLNSPLSYPSSPSPSSTSLEPDFATIFASQRFFFSSPGRSNSIIETAAPSSSDAATSIELEVASSSSNSKTRDSLVVIDRRRDDHINENNTINPPAVKDSVAVPTYSPNPYMDFRRSMQEMVEARDLVDVKANWGSLHELLSCYLELNPESTHKFILGAFSDLLVSLLSGIPPDQGSY